MAKKAEDFTISLFESPGKVVSSVVYNINAPNFFIKQNYNATPFNLKSEYFKFADSMWYFEFESGRRERLYTGEWITDFILSLVRLNFQKTKQRILCKIELLDADDKEYEVQTLIHDFEKDRESVTIGLFDNRKPSCDMRYTLTFIIDLFRVELTEMDADQVSFTTDRGVISLSQNFKGVLLNGADHNVTFNVTDKKFRAHQDILRARSEVFRSMLRHDMLEKNSGVINEPDCDPEAFEQLLHYIYTGKLERLDTNIMFSLYYAADKHNLENLKEECCMFIKKSLSTTNVCDVLELASKHCDKSLLNFTTSYFFRNIDIILTTLEWESFMKENSSIVNELLLKALKKDLLYETTEKASSFYPISPTESPRKVISSAVYTLKLQNFLTLAEPDSTCFEYDNRSTDSPSFEFANNTWCFRIMDETMTETGNSIKEFNVFLIRLNFETREQFIFYETTLLDPDDNIYHEFAWAGVVDDGGAFLVHLNYEEFSYDRRDNLTLIINLFHIESTEVGADQVPVPTDRALESLSQDFKDVLLNGEDHNITFNVKDKKFRAHRDILCARSEVFRSELNLDVIKNNDGIIDVLDCDPLDFKQFLLYIYTGHVETLNENNMLGLYYIANKYKVDHLKEMCCCFIKKSLAISNVCAVIEFASKYSEASLLACASSYFIDNLEDIIPTTEFQLCMKENSTVVNELFIKSFKKAEHP